MNISFTRETLIDTLFSVTVVCAYATSPFKRKTKKNYLMTVSFTSETLIDAGFSIPDVCASFYNEDSERLRLLNAKDIAWCATDKVTQVSEKYRESDISAILAVEEEKTDDGKLTNITWPDKVRYSNSIKLKVVQFSSTIVS